MNNKRVVYEGIRISVQALTLFIAIGLLTLALLIWYAAAQGNVFEDGAVIDMEALLAKKIIRKPLDGLKVLGNGELTKKVTVKAAVFSATAKAKIEAVGGQAEEV